ncbi:hypothetical protein VM1G_11593 [Cytospora mali]|uniref:Uncharacterized protein n=1 Tax=Cytospora mali TaxID=578113 RepID=A0A194VZL6_CYTMA|nr:hypothetical protein VM1G_11593 [Valsa mali]
MLMILGLLVLPETYVGVLLSQKAKKLRKVCFRLLEQSLDLIRINVKERHRLADSIKWQACSDVKESGGKRAQESVPTLGSCQTTAILK